MVVFLYNGAKEPNTKIFRYKRYIGRIDDAFKTI